MKIPELYRRRLIPEELIPLKDDVILHCDDEIIVTKWKTLHPKSQFSHGASCYFMKKGFKISKFYMASGELLYWYCDIVDYAYEEEQNRLTVIDLLADVIVHPDGSYKVVDLDEMGEAYKTGILPGDLLINALIRLDNLLKSIYNDEFKELQRKLEIWEEPV